MFRLIKYLKPYIFVFIITIALLFVQANADLALPDYMSKIINNGIQQGGVENAVPEAIRESTMHNALIFMNEEEKETVLGSYLLINQGDNEYSETYPSLSNEPIYLLKDIDKEGIDSLDPIMGKSLMIVSFIEQISTDPSVLDGMDQTIDIDLSKIPPGMSIFDALSMMPADQQSLLTSNFDSQIEILGESMVSQMAVGLVKTEYEALGMDTEKLQSNYILRNGGTMLLISLLGGVTTIAVSYFGAKTAAGVARDIRRDLFEKVESFSSAEFNKFSTASLITRSTNDITQVQMLTFMVMRMVFYAPILGVGAVIRAMGTGASMSWIIAAAVLTLLSFIGIVFAVALPKFKIIQSLIDRLNLVTRENLSGMMVIRSFNKQKFEEKRFDKANVNLTSNSLYVARVMVTMMPFMMLIMNGLSLLIIWVGSHQVAEANMQVGDMMAFLQYSMQIVMSFLMMTMMFIFMPRAAVSGARIADVLETELQIKDPKNPKTFNKDFKAKIEFKNVSFKYPGAPDNVIEDISFTAEAGETTAFIGSTGCGKSTVVNLIPRFYDISEGEVLVNDIDVRQVLQSELRDKIGYVPQKGTLFSGTIDSNLRYADQNATEKEIKDAIEIAQASEFVYAEEDGVLAEISQGGSNVSGGQKQRLAIARALVKKPPIYIFDDSFSALDFKTDSALRKQLNEKTGESTVLIVTQRVATVKNADQIIVLDKGRIVGKGKHDDLMKNSETYQEIAMSQLSKEELS